MYVKAGQLQYRDISSYNCVSLDFTMIEGVCVDNKDDWAKLLNAVATTQCRSSFKEIYDYFYPRILAQALKSRVERQSATDLAQESLLKVWHQAKNFDPTKGNASLWIFVIARNTKFDFLRKLKNDPLRLNSGELYDELDREVSHQSELETLFEVSELKNHINNLPLAQKVVMQKIYIEGMTQQEVADQEDIPLGTVKSRTRLAVAQIRKEFKDNLS